MGRLECRIGGELVLLSARSCCDSVNVDSDDHEGTVLSKVADAVTLIVEVCGGVGDICEIVDM